MKANEKKIVLGASLVGIMTLASGCSAMGMCGGSKCGNDKKAGSSKCGGEKKEASAKCGSK